MALVPLSRSLSECCLYMLGIQLILFMIFCRLWRFLRLYFFKHFFPCVDPEGRTGGPEPPPPPLESHKNIGFLSNTGSDPEKSQRKLPRQDSNFGHHWHASETPYKWHFAGGSMWPTYSCIWTPSSSKIKKKGTPSEKTFWIRACFQ